MKKTFAIFAILTAAMFLCQSLHAQQQYSSKMPAPEAKPVLITNNTQVSKSPSNKPLPPLAPIAPVATDKKIQQDASKTAGVSPAPGSATPMQIQERNRPGEGAAKVDLQEPAMAVFPAPKQSITIVEPVKPAVKEEPKSQSTSPAKNN